MFGEKNNNLSLEDAETFTDETYLETKYLEFASKQSWSWDVRKRNTEETSGYKLVTVGAV